MERFFKTEDNKCYYHLRANDVLMVNVSEPLIIIHSYKHYKYMQPSVKIEIDNSEFNDALNKVIILLDIFNSDYSN